MISLSRQDIQELKDQGYNENDIQTAMREVERESLNSSFNNIPQNTSSRNNNISTFSTKANDDIVRWQLELNDILERAEHILRGDVPKIENNEIFWSPNPFPEDNALNEKGIQEIMKRLAMYVNRNTILSDYSNEEIHIKVFDFTRELNNLVYTDYDNFGMDNENKRKNYPMLIKEIEDIVHSTYKRALDGAEKRSLREMISISQATNQNLNPYNQNGMNDNNMNGKERGLLNPFRYVKGRYV
jgi:hypothetical protein